MPVSLTQAQNAVQHTTKTDNTGRFLFTGPYNGLVQIHTGRERGYLATGRRIPVDPNRLTRVDIKVTKGGVLVGRVTNENKEPMMGAVVQARREGFRFGRPILLSSFTRTSNSNGEYRIAELDPGDYVIQVLPRPLKFEFSESDTSDISELPPRIVDAPTYFVNSPDRFGAAKVTVQAGGGETRADLSIVRAKSVCIASILDVPFTGPARNPISLVLGEPYPMSQSRIAVGTAHAGGTLKLCGVPPGTYRLSASTTTHSGEPLVGAQSFVLSGSHSVQLPPTRLTPLASVTGTLTVENKEGITLTDLPDTIRKITISLDPNDRLPFHGESLSAQVTSLGTFSLLATYADYWVRIDGVPAELFVKSAQCNGMDAFRNPFSAGAGELKVVLGNDPASVTGKTTDSSGHPIAGATVLLLNVNASQSPLIAPNELFHVVSDVGGHFAFSSVPPGDYSLAAYLDMPARQEFSGQTRRAIQSSPLRVRLSGGERHSVTIPARSMPQ